MKFHDGKPMTAADVKAAIDRTIKLNQGAAYIWGAVKSIDAPDATTVVFHLKYPAPIDLISSAGYAAFIYDTKAVGLDADWAKWFAQGHDAGTGPYTVAQWNKGQEIELRLKSFPGYWGGWSGAALQERRVPRRARPPAPRPSSCVTARSPGPSS